MSLPPPHARFGLTPPAQGMYDPAAEKDACGLAMVATLRGTAGHDIITAALDALRNLEHRGAVGSDAGTGDGAGIITQVPDAFLREVADFPLPEAGAYAVGNAFLPVDPTARSQVKQQLRRIAASEGLEVIGWREVPVRPDELDGAWPHPDRHGERCRHGSELRLEVRERAPARHEALDVVGPHGEQAQHGISVGTVREVERDERGVRLGRLDDARLVDPPERSGRRPGRHEPGVRRRWLGPLGGHRGTDAGRHPGARAEQAGDEHRAAAGGRRTVRPVVGRHESEESEPGS